MMEHQTTPRREVPAVSCRIDAARYEEPATILLNEIQVRHAQLTATIAAQTVQSSVHAEMPELCRQAEL
jgi:hypothetical protein